MASIGIGAPVKNLKLVMTTAKNAAPLRGYALEALKERQSKDEDLNRDLTKNNEYWGIESGRDLITFYEEKYRLHEGRHRKDATVGLGLVLKPLGEGAFDNFTEEQQKKFLADLKVESDRIFEDNGLEVVSEVLHRDEQVPHYHVFLFDPEFKCSKKNTLRFKNQLNSLLPRRMRERGWDCRDLTKYDIEKAEQDPEYKANFKQKKEKHGMSSAEYKAKKELDSVSEQKQEMEQNAQKLSRALREALLKNESLQAEADKSNFYREKWQEAVLDAEAWQGMLIEERKKEPETKVVEREKVVEVEKIVEDKAAKAKNEELEAENDALRRKLDAYERMYHSQTKGSQNEDLSPSGGNNPEYERE